jgi:ribonuclease Z
MLALTILGNNSAIPAFGRYPTAQVLQTSDESYLIDCGEGTQMQIAKYKLRKSKISRIFISHLHGDHYFGLIGLITSMSLLGRTQELTIYGPAALEAIIRSQLNVANTMLTFPLHFYPLTTEGIIVETSKITVRCFTVQHRIECWGYLFKQKKNPRKIDIDRARSYEIPASFYDRLQLGEDYTTKKGTIIPNEEVTLPGTPAKSYAYCADTIFDPELAEKVKGVDLLYHETTYLKGNEAKAKERHHCTTEQAAQIAILAEAKRLVIGHFSAKYEALDDFLTETRAIFPNTELALEGSCHKI